MSLAFQKWLKDLYYELSVFKDTALISPKLVDEFQAANKDFLTSKYKLYNSLKDLGSNPTLPILAVLAKVPETEYKYPIELFVQKLKEEREVELIPVPDFETIHSKEKEPETSTMSDEATDEGTQTTTITREGGVLKVSEFLPDTFQGYSSENAMNHFQKYRDYCTIHNLSDDAAIERFRLTLTGLPRQWIKDRNFRSLNDLEEAFTRQYSKYKSREALIRALAQFKYVPGTPMEKYLADIKELAGRVGQNSEQIRDHFVNGLPDEMRSSLVMHTYADLNELVEKAQKFIELNPKWASPQVSFAITDSISMSSLAKSIDEIKGELKSLKERRPKSPFRQGRGRYNYNRPSYRPFYGQGNRPPPRSQNFIRRNTSRERNRSYQGRGNGRGRGWNRGYHRNRAQSRSPQRSDNRRQSQNF